MTVNRSTLPPARANAWAATYLSNIARLAGSLCCAGLRRPAGHPSIDEVRVDRRRPATDGARCSGGARCRRPHPRRCGAVGQRAQRPAGDRRRRRARPRRGTPFCLPAVIDRLLPALDGNDGAVPVLPVADTLALGDKVLDSSVDRRRMLRVQTPQAFHVEDLIYAYEEAGAARLPTSPR